MIRAMRWVAATAAAVVLGCTGALAATAAESPGRTGAMSDDARADYLRGYGDGLKGKMRLERDNDYRAGLRAGRAMREANDKRPDGPSYGKGYIDGFDHYLERKAPPASDRAYAVGYRAGQADRTAMASGAGRPQTGKPAPPADAPYTALVGTAESQLEAQMRARGFVKLSMSGKGRDRGAVWKNTSGNALCVESTARDGIVTAFSEPSEFVCR